MDDKSILELLPQEYPIGIGGCRSSGESFDPCEYNVTIFDGKDSKYHIIKEGNYFIKINHGSLNDTHSDVLVHYDGMRIINDPSWELQMLLQRLVEKRSSMFSDYAKNCILNSIFCCTKAKEGIADVFAPCWYKSALIYLANSILALHDRRPTATHSLEKLRNLEKNYITDKISIIHDTMGIHRATPSLLDRMCKSTIGFSEQIEKTQHSLIIKAKHDYFVKNSMLADCYFYLTYVNHVNFISLKNSIHRNPDLIYILKVAFDLENDDQLQQNIVLLQKTCNDLFANISQTGI